MESIFCVNSASMVGTVKVNFCVSCFPLFESENCLPIIYSEAVISPCCLAKLEIFLRLKESVIIPSAPAVPTQTRQRGLVIVVAHELVSAHFDTFGLGIFAFWLQCPKFPYSVLKLVKCRKKAPQKCDLNLSCAILTALSVDCGRVPFPPAPLPAGQAFGVKVSFRSVSQTVVRSSVAGAQRSSHIAPK